MADEAIYTAYLKGSLRLSSTGQWFHNGEPFTNTNVSRFFHRHVVWSDKENQYYIAYGKGRAEFDCDGTAYFVVALLDDGCLPLKVRLADESVEELDLGSLSVGPANELYCEVKGGHRATFCKGPYQQITEFASSEDTLSIYGKEIKIS